MRVLRANVRRPRLGAEVREEAYRVLGHPSRMSDNVIFLECRDDHVVALLRNQRSAIAKVQPCTYALSTMEDEDYSWQRRNLSERNRM